MKLPPHAFSANPAYITFSRSTSISPPSLISITCASTRQLSFCQIPISLFNKSRHSSISIPNTISEKHFKKSRGHFHPKCEKCFDPHKKNLSHLVMTTAKWERFSFFNNKSLKKPLFGRIVSFKNRIYHFFRLANLL